MTHISKTIVGTEGSELEGKLILHCITSSISCYIAPQISRKLMRHGAEVITVLSPEAAKFVHPMIFEWATGKVPITAIEGKVEHVQYAGLSEDKADLILIAPITASSLSKIANGIMDTPVTLIAGTALGNKIPIIMTPTMHEVMFHNPVISKNIKKLEEYGVKIIKPRIEEEKAKIPSESEILEHCIQMLSKKDFSNKKILITSGPTRVYLDGMRFISNPSSGKMGFALAVEAWRRGADVKLVYGMTSVNPPSFIHDRIQTETEEEMLEKTIEILLQEKIDYVILAAAMNDFGPEEKKDEKVSSGTSWDITLKPLEKLADKIKSVSPDTKLVLFKAEYNKNDDELVQIAKTRLERANAEMIIANDISKKEFGFKSDYNRIAIITEKEEIKWVEDKKTKAAEEILSELKAL